MAQLTFGLNRRPVTSVERYLAAVRREEELGFAYSWLPDSQMLAPDTFVFCGLALQSTSRIRIGPLLTNPVTRHPATIANAAATLGMVGPGRAAVGIGGGDTAVHTIGRRPARVAEVGEALRVVRELLHGGKPYRRGDLDVGLATRGSAELWGAASGPRAAKAAGAAADAIVLRAGLHPGSLNALIAAAESGARDAGRDPGELRFAAVVHALLYDDPEQARAEARVVAAGFYELSPATWQRAGLVWNGPPIAEISRRVFPDIVHAQDIPAAARLVDFVSNEVADAFSLHGDQAAVAAGLERLAAGVPRLEHVITQPLTWTPAFPERIAAAAGVVDGVSRC